MGDGLCCGVHGALSDKVLPWVICFRTTGFIFFSFFFFQDNRNTSDDKPVQRSKVHHILLVFSYYYFVSTIARTPFGPWGFEHDSLSYTYYFIIHVINKR